MSYGSWWVNKLNIYMILSAWGRQIGFWEQVTTECDHTVWSLVYNLEEPAVQVRKCYQHERKSFGAFYSQNLRIMGHIKAKEWDIPSIYKIHKILVVSCTGVNLRLQYLAVSWTRVQAKAQWPRQSKPPRYVVPIALWICQCSHGSTDCVQRLIFCERQF